MMNLKDVIENALEQDEGNYRSLDFNTTQFISLTLMNDKLFNSIHPSVYDGVIIPYSNVKIGEYLYGASFFDKKKRFLDGYYIRSSVIKSITKLRHEIYRVETMNSAYLVIM